MSAESLVFTDIQVDVETGKSQLKDFEKAAQQTATSADASAKKIESSFKNSTANIFGSSDLKRFDDAIDKIRGVSQALSSVERIASGQVGGLAQAGTGLSNLASGIGGISLAAGVAAVGIGVLAVGISKLAEAADQITSVHRAFETLTTRVGESASVMLGAMHQAARGFVSDFELMRSANEAVILEIPITADKMSQLVQIATQLHRAGFGASAAQELDKIVEGIGRESARMLRSAGVLVDLKKAHEDYAAAIGKTSAELTDAEKRTADLNAVLVEGAAATDKLGTQSLTLSEEMKLVSTGFGNLKNEALDFANVGLGSLVEGTAKLTVSIAALVPEAQNLLTLLALLRGGGKEALADPRDQAAQSSAAFKALEAAVAAVGVAFKATNAEGLALASGYDKLYVNLSKLGVSIGEQYGKIQTIKGAIAELREQLKATDDVTLHTLINHEIVALENEMDKLLGKSKELKKFWEEAGPLGSVFFGGFGKPPKMTEDTPKDQQPFGGVDIFNGRPRGASIPREDRSIRENPFGDSNFKIGETSPQLTDIIAGLGPVLSQEIPQIRQMREELLAMQDAANEAGKSFGVMALDMQLIGVAMEAIQGVGQDFARVLVQLALTGHGSAKELRKAMGDTMAGLATQQFAMAIVDAAIGAVASTPWGLAIFGPPAPYFKAAGAQAAAGGVALAAARVLGSSGGGGTGGSGGGGGAGGTGTSGSVNYAGAIKTPAGDLTGSTPVVVGDAQRRRTGNLFIDGAPPPVASSAPATVVNHYHQHTYTINAVDSRSFREYVNTPDARRALNEAVTTEQARR